MSWGGGTHTPAHRGPQRALDLHRIHTQLHLWTSQTQSQSHKPTHTGIHKELRIFIVFTRGCIHGLLKPSLVHIQAPSAIPTLHSLYHTCTQHKVTGLYGYTGSSINTHAQRSIYTATQSQSVTQSRSRTRLVSHSGVRAVRIVYSLINVSITHNSRPMLSCTVPRGHTITKSCTPSSSSGSYHTSRILKSCTTSHRLSPPTPPQPHAKSRDHPLMTSPVPTTTDGISLMLLHAPLPL